jgi:hypothetical protein
LFRVNACLLVNLPYRKELIGIRTLEFKQCSDSTYG